ncbi:MAG: FAD-dependent oxidoreductase [Bacteroidetes bacterium]|nr:FAD-dependent oxidoreductase [Bacteroidota bacterium]
MNELNIILDNNIVKGYQGETIYEVAKRNGIEIPTLCHDPRIDPYTSCYVCVVEVEGLRGLQPSCSTRITEGMKVDTHTERVTRARKTALDLLLSNHYADCVAPCKETCPAGVDVQGYISFIEKGMYSQAVELIKETNPLPAICGRVCVRPCEVACRRNLMDEGHGVGIDYLKRFASDQDLASPDKWKPKVKENTGKKISVIGAGPGGLSAAFFLRKEGHEVDIYEAGPNPGGWLRYGIPEYRLPNEIIDKEVENITEMGVKIFYKKRLGDNVSYKDLQKKYDAMILAIGSQKGTLVGCEGDDALNVFSGVDFLKEMEMTGKRFNFKGKKVVVVGGGNTAMDCCRSAMRCGADKTYIIYRRTEKEMPANPIEIHESKLEGIEYLVLTNPTRINKDEEGKVKSMTCLKMELGEPDSSGRRRPIPVQGSEFDIEIDYVLAAIGQKTDVNFLKDINQNLKKGELKVNRWGDIEADPKTLQTGVAGIFAAGDSVTGPATLIQAVGQARVAARACHQFLTGEEIKPYPFEFVSRKDHFKKQQNDDYVGSFSQQLREEMPTLDPKKRKNFKEVELGYQSEDIARHETQRCLECGCTEYYVCDLKRYGSEYQAEQQRLGGEFKEYQVDFRHPFIEIDSNKCILCSRCIRICREIVGANALGLINRGYDTYVAPSMGLPLQETSCESCGMCISTCPTGAITENFSFKPGPVKLTKVETVCNYCSIGCTINLHHKNGYVMKVTGESGPVNKQGNLCRFGKFGYLGYNDVNRITKPLLKIDGRFEEISFKKAFKLISQHITSVIPDENAFFAGARLTNEEQYLVQKLARFGAKTNNVTSFHYLNRGFGYVNNSTKNVPFEQLPKASKIFLIGAEINRDNAVAGFMINNVQYHGKVPVELVTDMPDSPMRFKADRMLRVKSYYYFVKAVNYYLVANNFQNQLFIDDQCEGFEEYKEHLLQENFVTLVEASGVTFMDQIVEFAKDYNQQMNAIIVFSEKELGANACQEIRNLSMITGKLGKTSNGLISLKEKNNAQGLFDMGVCPVMGVGAQPVQHPDLVLKMQEKWGTKELPTSIHSSQFDLLEDGAIRNIFIFGEDPLGCATNKVKVSGWLSSCDFVVVQDYFMTKTAQMASLVLPASFPAEIGGSFSNTQKVLQEFKAVLPEQLEQSSLQQLLSLLKGFGSNHLETIEDVMMESVSLFPVDKGESKNTFTYTEKPNFARVFRHGCDNLHMRMLEGFKAALGKEF